MPYYLMFQLGIDPDNSKTENGKYIAGELVPIALIQEPLEFWDTILSAFIVYAGKLWDHSPAKLARAILHVIEKVVKIHPDKYKNAKPVHFGWLFSVAEGTQQLKFLNEPLKWTCVMDLKLYFHQIGGYKADSGDEEANKANDDFVEKRIDALATKWEEIFGPIKVEGEVGC